MFGIQYSLAAITAILRANGLRDYQVPFAASATRRFDIYFRTYAIGDQVHFLRDTIEYFLAKPGQWRNRRVGFIFESQAGFYALVIKFTQFNQELAQALLQHLQLNPQLNNAETIITSPIWENFARLYTQLTVDILLLPAIEVPALLAQLGNQLPQHYQAAIQLRQHPITDQSGGAVFAAQIISLLRTEQVAARLPDNLRQHQVENLFAPLITLAQQSPAILSTLRIIIKYKILVQQRAAVPLQGRAEAELAAIDHQLKCTIFRLPINTINEVIMLLSFEELQQYQQAENAEALRHMLLQQKQEYYQQIMVWEQGIRAQTAQVEQGWLSWGAQRACDACIYVYERSIANVAGVLSEWAAQALLAWFNRNPDFGTSIVKKIGVGLGISYMYSMGIMNFFPMIAIIFLAERVRPRIVAAQVNIAEANVRFDDQYLPSLQTLIRAGDVFFSVLYGLWTQNSELVARSSSLAASSIFFEKRVAPEVIKRLDREQLLNEQDRNNLRYLISMVGMHCGALFYDTVFKNAVSKMVARPKVLEAAEQFAKDSGYVYHHVQFPSWLDPRVWFTADDHLSLSLGTTTKIYYADCRVMHHGFAQAGMVECVHTSTSPPLLGMRVQ
ncbi:MAG: hypothetical protein K5Q00_04565 [Gammaproteobacteria bacterium]|nr:hypothetical protein [Gammaproteobacteria bacterium]